MKGVAAIRIFFIGHQSFTKLKLSTDILKELTFENGQIAGAELVIFSDAPLPKNHPFWKDDKTMFTPHTAGSPRPDSVMKKVLRNCSYWNSVFEFHRRSLFRCQI